MQLPLTPISAATAPECSAAERSALTCTPWMAVLRPPAGQVILAGMPAQPISAGVPEDPAAILGLLPERWHEEFLAEYRQALEAAREVRRWPFLAELLHRWHLRAVAYSDPEFSAAVREARDARPEDLIPVPGWPARL
jgi:hypothetical protein